MTFLGALTVEVVVETPRGSRNKLEIDDDGIVRLDRRLPASLTFPADYGFVPGTESSDGERLDALVLTPEPTYPGVRVRGRAIGVFWLVTGHGREPKLVVVPEGEPMYEGVHDLGDLSAHQLAELSHFFDVYRDLDPSHDVRSAGSTGAPAAAALLERCTHTAQ
jgi:inorganic pyrophosphatase